VTQPAGEVGCLFCGSVSPPALDVDSAPLRVVRCPDCDHRQALHNDQQPRSDYYEHTPQAEAFVRSLEITRRRQAKRIIADASEVIGDPSGWLDFGCGRGWFLDEMRAADATQFFAGFDTSSLSRQWLAEQGIEVAQPSAADALLPDFDSLSFPPRIMSFLDVVEHFAGEQAFRLLQGLSAALPSLEWLVIKVPISSGFLYRTAHMLRRIAPGPYRQLYQVGTFPPHYHYFNVGSLTHLIEKVGYEIVRVVRDPDVDNLFHRIPALSSVPGGALVTRAIRVLPQDTAIAFARRKPNAA
jgi:hypothetical protein